MLQIASPKSIQKLHLLYVMYVNLNISCFAGFHNIGESLSQYVVEFILYMYIWFLLKVKYSVNYYVFQICKKITEVFHLCDHLMQHSTLPNLSRYLAQKNRRYSY